MKTTTEIMDKVRLHTIVTVAVLMLFIVLHNTLNPHFMWFVELMVVVLWLLQWSEAEYRCDIIKTDALLDDGQELVVLDDKFFNGIAEVLK